MHQLLLAQKLMERFSPRAIALALRSREGATCWSLSAPWLVPLIEREQAKLAAAPPPAAPAVSAAPAEPPPPHTSRPGMVLGRPAHSPRKSLREKLT